MVIGEFAESQRIPPVVGMTSCVLPGPGRYRVTALLLLLVVAGLVWAKPSHSSLDASDLADIAQVEDEVARIKRSGIGSGSGSFDLLSGLKKTLLSGIGSASASLVAGSSSSSLSSGSGHASGGSSGDGGHSYGHSSSSHSYEKPHVSSHFDGWSLKKSILNTLFQAVKAITGGVTAIKGQLIKGSGYLVSGAGKLIATGGDAVTGVGKKIALSAHLIPPKHAAHPFAKLSGLLSSSSGALSSSSSPSSSHNHEEHHESSAESYTDYAGPTSYAGTHDSSHGSFSSSGPSGPAFHSPPHKSSHKTPSINSYGVDLDDHHQQQQQHHHGGGSYVSGGTGGKYSHSSSDVAHHYPVHVGGKGHPANVVEASDVLRQILNQKVAPEHAPKKVIAQYEIPSDSHPPPFKPMKHGYLPPHPPPPPSGYGLPVGLIDSVTHSHSITTSFGHAASPFPSSYDIYRSMSLKHGHQGPDTDSFSSPRSKPHGAPTSVAYELLPPKPGATGGEDEFVHNQQLHDLAKHLGNGIEVQRSLTYEIEDPALSKHKRRSDETSDTNDDDNDAAPAVAAGSTET
ncbi:putative lysozyme-like protein [Anopheles cruzii]|uniref:putative lysozyme-like protein n=1 Tax=Anopheles cruzii TaxID=68878 RepID=UPI0022EC4726|nr:putative lysozyme-like protein [Anopheles cruzii]